MTIGLSAVGAYVLLVGVASFIESPIGRGFGAVQLNSLTRTGSAVIAVAALVAVHGFILPAPLSLAAGLGIGLLAGAGSICYCFALGYLPVSVVVCVANLSFVVTIVLGVAILHESVVPLKVGAAVLTVAGALVFARWPAKHGGKQSAPAPARHGVQTGGTVQSLEHRLPGFGLLGLYVALVGVSTFLEKPALRRLDVTQLNALQAIGMLIVAAAALGAVGKLPKPGWHLLGGVGVGAMVGVGAIVYFQGLTRLPVSIAVGAANGYVVVTVLLSVLIGQAGWRWSTGLALGLTVAGVMLFAFSA